MSDNITREQQVRLVRFGSIIGVFFASVAWMAKEDFWDEPRQQERWQSEAVRHGAAKWTVDESGKRVFEWNDKTEEAK